jgi:hypothetical protein
MQPEADVCLIHPQEYIITHQLSAAGEKLVELRRSMSVPTNTDTAIAMHAT